MNTHIISKPEPLVYGEVPVITTELLAREFGTAEKNLHDNFSNNAQRFTEGVHFHRVIGDALRDLKRQPDFIGVASKFASHLILWTERGVFRHAKILETDQAWQAYERLEDTYFAVRRGDAQSLPNFSDPVAAARAWADQYEARLLAERTKAEIGHRREATAMNTASQAVKKANKLAQELDRSRQYATVKRMSMLYHGQEFRWRELKHVSAEMGIPPVDVFDANYGTVKAYHADVWREAYALEIPQGEGV